MKKKTPSKKPAGKKPATKSRAASPWYPLSNVPAGFFSTYKRSKGSICSAEEAESLSPYFAAINRYANTISSLPLVVYRRGEDGGRERARSHPAYPLLHERPNASMPRSVFFRWAIKELFQTGECFVQVQKDTPGKLLGLYPIRTHCVEAVYVDSTWKKAYKVRDENGVSLFADDEVIHLHINSRCGIRGIPTWRIAAESLGLHRQILESADAFYHNSARPSGYIKYPGMITPQALANLKEEFKNDYAGTGNTGKIPILQSGGEFVPFPFASAEEAKIVEAMGESVGDIARWFDLSPIQLGDFSSAHYASLAADNTAFYQRSIRPKLDDIELEFNAKIFGVESEYYCEFLTESILRGDPYQQAEVDQMYIQMGVSLRSEIRERLNLPPISGLDVPLFPLNMGPEMATKSDNGGPQKEDNGIPNPNGQ